MKCLKEIPRTNTIKEPLLFILIILSCYYFCHIVNEPNRCLQPLFKKIMHINSILNLSIDHKKSQPTTIALQISLQYFS